MSVATVSGREPTWRRGSRLVAGKLGHSPSLRLVGKRLLAAAPILWGVTFLTFVMMNLLPGDAAVALLGGQATPGQIHQLQVRLHLNEPFLLRYGHWLLGALGGDLGTSLTTGQGVTTMLAQRFPVTLELVLYAFVISVALAVPVAVLAARRPGGVIDRLSTLVSISGLSIAPFVLALVLSLVFSVKLHIFPALGFVPLSQSVGENLRSLALPAVSIGIPLFCTYTRVLRADLVEQLLSEDYVKTAEAKGATELRVLVRHVLRNAMFGMVTLVGLNFGTLIGSTVLIEEIFSLPGLGQGLVSAINERDVVFVEGAVLVFGAVVVLANLVTDLLYGVLDPRIRHGRSAG